MENWFFSYVLAESKGKKEIEALLTSGKHVALGKKEKAGGSARDASLFILFGPENRLLWAQQSSIPYNSDCCLFGPKRKKKSLIA
ncbi:hypothetical protein SAY86_013418 [Trapa natans]|uniref:Uncharacterized protein n=1 Tax=Trapa natans TaxID=22666 RepID=A0AAN7R833_TRANT|nr:hypothetical protein SAY86_013418 [Trapa natans]